MYEDTPTIDKQKKKLIIIYHYVSIYYHQSLWTIIFDDLNKHTYLPSLKCLATLGTFPICHHLSTDLIIMNCYY